MSTNTELVEKARAWSRQDIQALPWIAHDEMQALADALEAAEAELTRRDTVIAEAMDIEEWPYKPSQMQPYELDEATGYNQARTEFRRILAAAPVSLEAVKAETTVPPAFVDSVPNDGRYEYTTSSDCDGSNPYYRARVPARHAEAGPWFPITAEEYAAASQNWGPEWRPVSTEGDNRG